MRELINIIENSNSLAHTVDEYIDSLSAGVRDVYSSRDSCGPATLDYIEWMEDKGFELKRVFGEFRVDDVLHDKEDFTPKMKSELIEAGYDFDRPEDRKAFLLKSQYAEDWHYSPHYWAEYKGEILDPAGKLQFLNTGLASDMNPGRYRTIN